MSDLVTVSIAEGIADIRLNRPDKHNSLTLEMFDAINAAASSAGGPSCHPRRGAVGQWREFLRRARFFHHG